MEVYQIKKVACIGAGVIGASWATNFAMKGYPVCVCDIGEEQLAAAKKNIAGYLAFLVSKDVLEKKDAVRAAVLVSYTTNVEEAVKDAQFIQESGPENYEVKRAVLADIEKYAAADAIIASSTSGLLISEIAKFANHPERCLCGHPYNPPHLIPLVEITKGEKTSPEAVQCAYGFYQKLGKEPVVLQKETLGFIANRIQMAVGREYMDLVLRGVCSVEDIDKAITFGPGLRWAIMGPNLIMHLGGGEKGLRGLANMLRFSSNLWLEDMARWTEIPEEWAEVGHVGILKAIKNRPPELGKTTQEMIEYRDNMLIEILKLHKKL
ncbi:MAG: 3-hydroxyacyl-CoA dehydrogenase [Firmicutes bacterium]|nr:3-hydroxyacyl-CoA dehydrogenase [Bacillota bacterium]